MSDLATQIRTYLDDTAPPVTFDEIFTERIGVPPVQPTRPRPIPVGARGPLIAIAAAVVVLVIGAAAAILTLSGDGGNDVDTQPGPIASFEDIAGTYLRRGPDVGNMGTKVYFLFLNDGTIHSSSDTDLIADRPTVIYEARFDGTTVSITQTGGFCGQPDQGGAYEIRLLENGNLRFVGLDKDTCTSRSGLLLGLVDGDVTAEYEPLSAGG